MISKPYPGGLHGKFIGCATRVTRVLTTNTTNGSAIQLQLWRLSKAFDAAQLSLDRPAQSILVYHQKFFSDLVCALTTRDVYLSPAFDGRIFTPLDFTSWSLDPQFSVNLIEYPWQFVKKIMQSHLSLYKFRWQYD